MAGRPPPPRYVQLRTATRGEPDRSDGSRTITVENDNDNEGEAVSTPDFDGVLRLRGGPTHGNRVSWQEGTVDNEFLNRKKSKICCIFHKSKPKTFEDPFAESSSSSSSGSDDSDSSESECSSCNCEDNTTEAGNGQTPSLKGKERAIDSDNTEQADHNQAEPTAGQEGHEHSADCSHATHKHKHKSRRPKPNAYEHQPKYGKSRKKRDKGSSTMTITENV